MTPPLLSPQLRESFRQARYELILPQGVTLLAVDRHSAPLGEWMRAHRHLCAAWLTACNPGGMQRADSLNETAQRLLESRLAGRYPLLRGTAIDPAGNWPPEPSLLAAGMPVAEAMSIAHDFGQLAFLWCATDAIPRLTETDQAERRNVPSNNAIVTTPRQTNSTG